MPKKKWYKRNHEFTPYTKADGQAVSDEFDSIQASFELIPEMRDDGKGFEESPLIPEPTDPMHPVPLKMLTETEKSVNNARDDVTAKAQQVAQDAQSVAANTLTTTQKANTATQAAELAQGSQQVASDSEDMARKWASNPVDEVVQDNRYSAFHYATKAAESATGLAGAEASAKSSAEIATQKADEAKKAADKARSIANGEVEFEKVLNVPSANTEQKGIVQLTSATDSDSEELGLTARAGKKLAELITKAQKALGNYIPKSNKSDSIDSESQDDVASSIAVKKAYDKAVEAKEAADAKQSPATTLAGYGIEDFRIQSFTGDINTLKTDGIFVITQVSKSQNLPLQTSCHIQVIRGGDAALCRQLAYIAYSAEIYERHQTNYQTDTWSTWVRIDVREEFDALKDIFIGIPIPYPLSTVPTGCLAMNGQRFDTHRYPKLAQKYPSGQLPDMRGEFLRGWDNGRGVDAGRNLLSWQYGTLLVQEANHRANNVVAPSGNTAENMGWDKTDSSLTNSIKMTAAVPGNPSANWFAQPGFIVDNQFPYVGMTRPRNITFNYICLAE
ncbi:MAG: tail fiber protein [Haemophilus pittmaniae]|uniref:tail fiber protein n=1 Tax=Haemophilus pittmaniae TaxID=249188 RepID=UPI0023F2FE4A|nr:tail fiber protein [Haemophilus pittmaniae]MBS6026353.1 tail fiber protein [Haemophilus pittmaniae]